MILDYLVMVVWLSPFYFALLVTLGAMCNKKRCDHMKRDGNRKNIEEVIFQIPTIGNFRTVNKIFETVKSYNLPVKLKTWVIIEERDKYRDKYICEKVVIVPSSFECEGLYKSRALEYARRLRRELVTNGSLTPNYLLLQGDDDSIPSKEFVEECLTVNADVIIGTITPKVKGIWNTILEYERCVACGMFCNFSLI